MNLSVVFRWTHVLVSQERKTYTYFWVSRIRDIYVQ